MWEVMFICILPSFIQRSNENQFYICKDNLAKKAAGCYKTNNRYNSSVLSLYEDVTVTCTGGPRVKPNADEDGTCGHCVQVMGHFLLNGEEYKLKSV